MNFRPRRSSISALLISLLALAACGGGEAPPPPAGDDAPAVPADAIPLPPLLPETIPASPAPHITPTDREPDSPPETPAPTWAGTLRVTSLGPVDAVFLHADDRPRVELQGEFVEELRRLQGGRIRAEGSAATGTTGPALVVTSYELVAMDGSPVWTGLLDPGAARGEWTLATGSETLRLGGIGTDARLVPGARIWVTGTRSEDRISVGSFGVIRPPS